VRRERGGEEAHTAVEVEGPLTCPRLSQLHHGPGERVGRGRVHLPEDIRRDRPLQTGGALLHAGRALDDPRTATAAAREHAALTGGRDHHLHRVDTRPAPVGDVAVLHGRVRDEAAPHRHDLV
jgi:hypothetical protein